MVSRRAVRFLTLLLRVSVLAAAGAGLMIAGSQPAAPEPTAAPATTLKGHVLTIVAARDAGTRLVLSRANGQFLVSGDGVLSFGVQDVDRIVIHLGRGPNRVVFGTFDGPLPPISVDEARFRRGDTLTFSSPAVITGDSSFKMDAIAVNGPLAVDGTVSFSAGSPITFNSNMTSSGTLSFTTAETATETTTPLPPPDDDITVNSGVTVQSTGGNVVFQSADKVVLNSTSSVMAPNGSVNLSAGTGDNDLDAAISLGGTVSTGGPGNVNLVSSGPVAETFGGAVSTLGTLTVTSAGGATLTGSNTVGVFNATNTASGNITLYNGATPLTVSGITETGGGSATVSTGANLTVSGTVAAAGGGNVTLAAPAGALNESGFGFVSTSGTLAVNAFSGVALGGGNTVATFNAQNTQLGGISFSNTAFSLTVTGISSFTSIAVSNTGAIALTGSVASGASGAVNISATGAVTETGGGLVSTGGTLTVNAVGGVVLGANNAVATFNATNSTSGNVILVDSSPVTVTGISESGGAVTLSDSVALTLAGLVAANGGGAVNLTAASLAITEIVGGAVTTAGTLTTMAPNGTTLGGANAVSAFNATNNGSGNLTLTNASPLTVPGIIELGGGSILINNTGAVSLSGSVSAGAGGAVTFLSSGSVSETGGGQVSTSGTLTVSSSGGLVLTGHNAVGTFGGGNSVSGSVSLANTASVLTMTGVGVTGGGSVTIVNSGGFTLAGTVSAGSGGAVTLSGGGPLTEIPGSLISTTGTLTVNSVGGAGLGGNNSVAVFNASNSTSGGISLTNTAGTLTIPAITQSGGGSIIIHSAGPVTLTGALLDAGGAVTLTSSGVVAEVGAGLVSTAGTLTANSIGGLALGGSNSVGGLNVTNAISGDVSVTNTAPTLTVTGLIESGGGSFTIYNSGTIDFINELDMSGNGSITGVSCMFDSPMNLGTHTLGVTGNVGLIPADRFVSISDVSGGTDFGHVNVTSGNVNLGGANLSLSVTYIPVGGDTLKIVSDPGGTISGTFAGLADGATVMVNGVPWRINYSTTAVTLTRPVSVPGQVTNVRASGGPGTGQVTVQWSAPLDDGGSAIIRDRVTPIQDGVAQTPIFFTSTATTVVISGLMPDHTYTYLVAVENATGFGPDSLPSNAITQRTPVSQCLSNLAAISRAVTQSSGGTPKPR